jgi:hypothetical protein
MGSRYTKMDLIRKAKKLSENILDDITDVMSKKPKAIKQPNF